MFFNPKILLFLIENSLELVIDSVETLNIVFLSKDLRKVLSK
jgi:hypothetical protein